MILTLNRGNGIPLYVQIKDQLIRLIENRSLKPGSKLPATRELALSLGVSRNVILLAYQELEAMGFISSEIGRGSFVTQNPPFKNLHSNKIVPEGKDNSAKTNYEGLFSTGWSRYFSETLTNLTNLKNLKTDDRLISFDPDFKEPNPTETVFPDINNFKKSINYAFDRYNSALLSSNSPQGFKPLLQYLVEFLSMRGIKCEEANILIVNGIQQGLSLVGRLFIDPGDTVLLENLTYPGALTIFRALQANCIGIPVNHEGLNLEIVASVLKRRRVKLLYTIPTFHNPLGNVLPLEKRLTLLQLCRENQTIIVEDDYAHELGFEKKEIPPLKAWDESEIVIYMGSFSETLFSGIRLSWIVAPREIIKKLILIKKSSDLYTSPILQAAVLEYLRRGFFKKLLKKKVLSLKKRSEAMHRAMEEYFPPEASWKRPKGGLYQWVEISPNIDSLSLFIKSRDRGVIFSPDRFFSVEEWQRNGFRLSFSTANEEEIDRGIKTIGDLMREILNKGSTLKPEKQK